VNPSLPVIVLPTGGAIHNVLGAPYRFLVTADQTGGALSLIEVTAPPQSAVPLHIHTREDETFFILDGSLEVQCGDQTLTLERNASAFLPRNIPHAYRNVENLSATYLVFITPGGFEKCLKEFASLPPGKAPAPETIVAIGQKYGLQFPPPN
jgi:quercetin dioxygenase-like cupin family protein